MAASITRQTSNHCLPASHFSATPALQCDHFFFLMEGEVQLLRGGVNLGTLPEGSFVVSWWWVKVLRQCC
jgi:hypothetical protein